VASARAVLMLGLPPVEGPTAPPAAHDPASNQAAQVFEQKGVYLIMKLKVPLLDLWLVTGRRLRAGYAHRYQRGYAKGWDAGSAETSREAEVHGHSDAVPVEGEPGATQHPPTL
jgi:hypothetical protein